MDYIESAIHQQTWKRYIDDMFLICPSDMTLSAISDIANEVNPKIQFTVEPASYSGPFAFFASRLYFKPIHSGSILLWNLHGPTVLLGELHRADTLSTTTA